MRLAIAGATGRIGARTAEALRRRGHRVIPITRSSGIDVLSGQRLDEALDGVEVVVDATNVSPDAGDATVERFGRMTRNLLDSGARAGVRHHVLLSIAGVDRIPDNVHYAGKREQVRLVTSGPLPWTVVPATQFHDFPEMVARWNERDGVAEVPPLLMQPISPDDVADVLADVAVGPPRGRFVDVAGPERHDLVDMARRTYQARGRDVTLVPTWSSVFGPSMAGDVLLPGDDAFIAPTTFDEWLSSLRPIADSRGFG
jgi:uncharacterized protein YbjT (DUF2867 family)